MQKLMNLRFAGRCHMCGAVIAAGDEALWDSITRKVRHRACYETSETPAPVAQAVEAVEAAWLLELPERWRAAAAAAQQRAAQLSGWLDQAQREADAFSKRAAQGRCRWSAVHAANVRADRLADEYTEARKLFEVILDQARHAG